MSPPDRPHGPEAQPSRAEGTADEPRDDHAPLSSALGEFGALLEAHSGGRFSIERELRTGGMSTVFLATDRKHGRRVAVKVLRADLAGRLGPERFEREIEIAARLNHPNILPLHDSGRIEGMVYYVMPYVEGESLRSRLDREGALPVQDAIAIAVDCAEALFHAHQHGVVHRDVKPENILLSEGIAVVADFGIAKPMDPTTHELTSPGMSVGTPTYLSPEQASGDSDVDGRADIYALGCVLYEMLVGEPPFKGATFRMVLARHLSEKVPTISVARPGIPPGLEEVVQKALEKHPADRYRTAQAFANALRTLPQRPGGVLRRAWWIAAAAAVASLALVLARSEWAQPDFPTAADSRLSRVAVLPLASVGTEEAEEAFADILTARLIDGLGSIEALTVISMAGVRPYAGSALPVDSIAGALRVGTLVDGTLEFRGDSVEVRFQLVDGESGDQLGSRAVGMRLTERHLVIDAVGDSIVRVLRETLGPTVELRQRMLETRSLAAFEHLQWALDRDAEFRAARARQDLPRARAVLAETDSLLAEAERLDPRWIEPTIRRAGLAEQRARLALLAERDVPDSVIAGIYRAGLEHADRALETRRGASTALYARGRLRAELARITGDTVVRTQAERDLRDALNGSPERARVLRTLSELLNRAGRYREALDAAERGYALDPYMASLHLLYRLVFDAAFALGEDEKAREWCLRGQREFPSYPTMLDCRLLLLAWSELEEPVPDSAWAFAGRALEPLPPMERWRLEPHLHTQVAAVLARAGMADSARAVMEGVLAEGARGVGDVASRVAVLFMMGDAEDGLAILRDHLAAHPEDRTGLARRRELERIARDEARLTELLGPPT